MNERPDNCTRCNRLFAQDDMYCTVYKNEEVKEVICWKCSEDERIKNYISTKEISSHLMQEASMCDYYAKEVNPPFNRLRTEAKSFYINNLFHLLEINNSVKEIHAKAREFENKHWLPTLRKYWNDTDNRGHSAATEDWKLLMWGCAGRVLITLQDTKSQGKGKFGGAWITLIFDDSADYAKGGIQGMCATKEEALGLLQVAIDDLPVMVPDGEVTLAGL